MYPRYSDPRTATLRVLVAAAAIVWTVLGCSPSTEIDPTAAPEKIPITTSSQEALEQYLTGRQLADGLRATDAVPYFRRAIELDDDFALAHLALSNSAPTAQEAFDSLTMAVDRAEGASAGEQAMIASADAAVRSDPEAQMEALRRLVSLHPDDERAQNLFANFYFGRQEYPAAIRHYVRATELAPEFAPPYNTLGYAQRFQERYAEAEETFKQYVRLLPDEPNPLDSYAELLMKLGRFEESIAKYRLALEKDPNFTASYFGIGTNLTFMERFDEAREHFETLAERARSVGESRQAVFGSVVSYVFAEDHASALEEAMRLYSLAEENEDGATMSGDLNLMGNILLHAGTLDAAAERFDASVKAIELAPVLEEVKEATRRNHLYDLGRLALAADDLEAAAVHLEQYTERATAVGVPFELRRVHELAGRLALAEGKFAPALAELEQANQQDPRVLYMMAVVCNELGDRPRAVSLAYKAANWNALGLPFGYVRAQARELLESIEGA